MYVSHQPQDRYLQEVNRIPLLTVDEEVELARRIKEGDRGALDQLTCANLRFVVSVAVKYQGQGLSLADLIEEGNYGLIKAAGRFDETRGFKFISYAVWWIREAILLALAEKSRVVRMPLNRISTINQVRRTSAQTGPTTRARAEARRAGRRTGDRCRESARGDAAHRAYAVDGRSVHRGRGPRLT